MTGQRPCQPSLAAASDAEARRELRRAAPTLAQAMLEFRIARECGEAVERALDDP